MESYDQLKDKLSPRAVLITPEHPSYDEARKLWNGYHDRKPKLIVQVATVGDVQAAVKFAVANAIPLSVRSAGHSVPGLSVIDDGLVIDTRLMRGIRINPEKRTARAESGCLIIELDVAAGAFGLATPMGTVSHTGIAGLSLGGGLGWLSRQYGHTVDNILSLDVVLADGSFVVVSEKNRPDLFWAMRGAGANFGVVTSFKFRLHPASMIYSAMHVYPLPTAKAILPTVMKFQDSAPYHVSVIPVLATGPTGHQVVVIQAMVNDPNEENAKKTLEPLFNQLPAPLVSKCTMMPFAKHQTILDVTAPHGRNYYFKGAIVVPTAELIDELIKAMSKPSSKYNLVQFLPVSGGASEVATDAVAYPHRTVDSRWAIEIQTAWDSPDPAEPHLQWIREIGQVLSHSTRSYSNFIGNPEDAASTAKANAAYLENLPRLKVLKAKYDPNNVFRANINIVPDQGACTQANTGSPDPAVVRSRKSLYQIMTGHWQAQALRAVAYHNIADLLQTGPKTAEELVDLSPTTGPKPNANMLYRTMRALCTLGIFREDQEKKFSLAEDGKLLCTNHPECLRPLIMLYTSPMHFDNWGSFIESFQNGKTVPEIRYGERVLWKLFQDPKNAALLKEFEEAMVCLSHPEVPAILASQYDFSKSETVVDMGGSGGFLVDEILKANPAIKHGIVLDLPGVIAKAATNPERKRVQFVAGDFFQKETIPTGGALYMFKRVLHDWQDEQVIAVLKNLHEVMPQGAKLLVIETVLPEPGNNSPMFGKWMDLLMGALAGGRDRTKAEWVALMAAAGFKLSRVYPTTIPLQLIEAVKAD